MKHSHVYQHYALNSNDELVNIDSTVKDDVKSIFAGKCVDIGMASLTALLTNKRWGCRNICIFGFPASYMAKYSRLVPIVDIEKCVNCGLCETDCRTGVRLLHYIKDNKGLVADSECIMCGSCSVVCKKDAISYQFVWNRKKFMNDR